MLIFDNVFQLILLRIGYFLFAIIVLWWLEMTIAQPRIANFPEKRWRFLFFYKSLNYLFLVGFIFVFWQWPIWVWLQLKMKLLPALVMDDLFNLLLLGGYLLFYLWQCHFIDVRTRMLTGSFRSYLAQYGYYWLFILSIILYLRLDYFYLPVVSGNFSEPYQVLIEILILGIFIVLQGLVLWVRRLKMVAAGFELREMVNEVANLFKIKVKNVRIWRLERVSNAFSAGLFYRGIFLTETLINSVSSEDLRMILGHECAHFKKHHLEIRILIIGLLTFLGLNLVEEYSNLHWSIYIIFVGIAILTYKAIARFQELKADELAAKVLGGSEKMALALTRVSSLNSTPSKFGFLIGLLVGHPDLETRVKRLRSSNNQE